MSGRALFPVVDVEVVVVGGARFREGEPSLVPRDDAHVVAPLVAKDQAGSKGRHVHLVEVEELFCPAVRGEEEALVVVAPARQVGEYPRPGCEITNGPVPVAQVYMLDFVPPLVALI